MLFGPSAGRLLIHSNAVTVASTTPGTNVTTHATLATSKGTAVQLIASTNFDAWGIWISAQNYALTATAADASLDILVGGATEDILIPDLLCGYSPAIGSVNSGIRQWFFPLYIPSGTRIAAQAAGRRVNTAMNVIVTLLGGLNPPFKVGRRVRTYGVTVPNGTSITTGASGANGSQTQITASSSEHHFAFLPSLQVTNDSVIQLRNYMAVLGIGAATEDEIGEWWFASDTSENMIGPEPCWPVFREVPSGTRLAMRVSNSGTNSDLIDAAIHAVT